MSSIRQTVWNNQVPSSTQLLQYQKDAAKSLWAWIADAFGSTNSQAAGLAATQVGATTTVSVAPGRLYQFLAIDPTAWASPTGLAIDSSTWLLQARLDAAQVLTGFVAPGTAGQSINYLIEAQVQVTDAAAVNTNFYNSATPGSFTTVSKSPSRANILALQVKAGTAATTGTQVTPTADAGWVPLYACTATNGSTTVTIANAASAPFFTGFVPNSGTANVLLNPASAQNGIVNLGPTSVLYNEGITLVGGVQSNITNLIPDSNLTIVAPAPPTALNTSGASSTGGNLAQSTTYYFKVTSSNANAESLGSAELSYTTPASGTSTNQITLNWTSPTGQTGAKVYIGTASGAEILMATLGNVSTYAVTAALPSGTAPPPTVAGSIGDWLLLGANVSVNVGGGNAGSNAIQFAGTGAASGTQTATGPSVPAISGQSYTFGIYVSGASNITTGTMQVGLVQAGTTTFVGTPVTINSATANGRVSLTVTNPTTPLQVYVTSNNCTIGAASNVLFSQPMENPGSVAQAYVVNTPGTYLSNVTGGFQSDYVQITGQSITVNANPNTSLALAGAISHTGGHAGTQADPYPSSQLNVTMLGGKPASAYALASGNYVILYGGAPTLGTGNAGVTGYLQSGVATGTAPFIVASQTMVVNLNANFLGGNPAGNASGNIPISNGILCTNLNAAMLGGVAASGYQLAGSYVLINALNTGTLQMTSTIGTTGGGGGANQVQIQYGATNAFGINSGNQVGYIQSLNYPLGLVASQVETNGPLYVGGSAANATRYNVSAQDLNLKGVLRSGMVPYRVTYSDTNNYPTPGFGTDLGYKVTPNGGLDLAFDEARSTQFYIGYRVLVTVNTPTNFQPAILGNAGCQLYVDGVNKMSRQTYFDGLSQPVITLSTGQHTIDFVFTAANMATGFYTGASRNYYGGHLAVFGWLPMSAGSLATTVTALAPG